MSWANLDLSRTVERSFRAEKASERTLPGAVVLLEGAFGFGGAEGGAGHGGEPQLGRAPGAPGCITGGQRGQRSSRRILTDAYAPVYASAHDQF